MRRQGPNMEPMAKGILMEGKQHLEVPDATDPVVASESPAKKASVFCFKKRKKACQKVTEKDEDQESNSLSLKPTNQHSTTEVSSPFWTSGEAWLAFRRLVTSRRRSKATLKKQTQIYSHVQLDVDSGGSQFPKERTGPSLSLPCLRLSRSKKRASRSEIQEQPDCGDKESDAASILKSEMNGEPETEAMEFPLNAKQSPSKDLQETEGDREALKIMENVAFSGAENAFPLEARPDPNCYVDCAVQSEITHSETALETEEEKQIFQLHHGNLYGNPEELENQRLGFNVEMNPLIPQDPPPQCESEHQATEATKKAFAGEAKEQPFGRDMSVMAEREGAVAKEVHAVEVMLHHSPSVVEKETSGRSGCSDGEGKREEDPLAMPGAGIVIMITEAEEYQDDEEEPALFFESLEFPQASKQKGKKKTSRGHTSGPAGNPTRQENNGCKVLTAFGTNTPEPWTSEQYEVLLMETAASLVKAAIQSSMEQLVSEMALEQNKQNSFL